VQGLPIRIGLTAGQTHDGQIADALLDHIGPRTIMLADKAYDADRIRELIQDRGATRYDKLAANFLAMVQFASMRLWLRAYESTA
jgi:transposase